MVVAFCGHAEFYATKEDEQRLLDLLKENVGEQFADLYLGGYGEFDRFAYECCKKYQAHHPNVSLILITPYMTVEYQRNHLEYQKKRYDEIIYPEIENRPIRFAIIYRNKWIVEKADCIICAITHDWGGAYKMYQYAKKQKKPIFNIKGKEF